MEEFEIFNEKNEPVGTATRSEVHRKGLIHRAVHVFLLDQQGNVFLQKRTKSKKIYPGHWDLSVAEHLQPGEAYDQAVVRGLKEELGILNATIRNIKGPRLMEFTFKEFKDNEFNALFMAESSDTPRINPEEIEEGMFVTIPEADRMAKTKRFTKPFYPEWEEFKVFLGIIPKPEIKGSQEESQDPEGSG